MKSTHCCAWLTAFVLLLSFVAGSAEAGLRAGAAKISVVPPFPTLMGGFYDRVKLFEGIHDEVYARALVLDNDEVRLAIIASDLRSVDAELVRLARQRIFQTIGIPPTHVLICSTHNHSGPSYHQKSHLGHDDDEPSLKLFLLKQFVDVTIEAHKALVPARAGFETGAVVGLTRNRQQKNDLIDPQVGVLRIESPDSRKTIATLFNFTGHPVIVGSSNLQLSGEYPGAACRAVENLLGGVAIFTQGACGDITVNRNGDPFLEVERLGRTVAGEVIKTSGLVKLDDHLLLNACSVTRLLPARELPSVEQATDALAKGKALLNAAVQQKAAVPFIQLLEDKNRVLSVQVAMSQAIADDPTRKETELSAEVQLLQVGDALFGAIPGELFVEYGLELRSRIKQLTGSPFCLVGYANGYVGYIVTPRGLETGGYEASVTRVQESAGRTLTETMMTLAMEGCRK